MANEILWALVNSLIRCTAIFALDSIFGLVRMFHLEALGLLLITVLHCFATVLATCLICHPIAAAWDNRIHGTCGDEIVAYVVLEVLGALIDVLIIILPLPSIWTLHTEWQRKMGLASILSIGVL